MFGLETNLVSHRVGKILIYSCAGQDLPGLKQDAQLDLIHEVLSGFEHSMRQKKKGNKT